ncbi:MAG: hypothetical protein ACOY94_12125 [Bacillota bacterium]
MHDPLSTLAKELADRPAAKPGERRASRWLVEQLRRSTYQVWVEPFSSFHSSRPAWGMILGLSLVGGILLRPAPGLGLVLTLLGAVGFAAQSLGWLQLGWLFPRGESQNVVGVIPANDEIRQRVVVVAHYDTGERLWAGPAFLTVAGAAMLLPPACVAALVLPGPLWDLLVLLPLTLMAAVLIALALPGRPYGNNAGVAVALAVGQSAPLKHTEVWTVFTGSRAPGLVGIQAFLLRHGRLLADGDFIVLEEDEGEGATLWQRRGEAAVIAEHGHRAAVLLPVSREDIAGTAARVRSMAEAVDREACNSPPSPEPDCGTLPV